MLVALKNFPILSLNAFFIIFASNVHSQKNAEGENKEEWYRPYANRSYFIYGNGKLTRNIKQAKEQCKSINNRSFLADFYPVSKRQDVMNYIQNQKLSKDRYKSKL